MGNNTVLTTSKFRENFLGSILAPIFPSPAKKGKSRTYTVPLVPCFATFTMHGSSILH